MLLPRLPSCQAICEGIGYRCLCQQVLPQLSTRQGWGFGSGCRRQPKRVCGSGTGLTLAMSHANAGFMFGLGITV
jgi:hypothetical protein